MTTQPAPLRVLVVDDDTVDRMTVKRLLGDAASVDQEEDGERAVERMLAGRYDCVLVDYDLPRRTGLEILREAIAAGVCAPIIALTGQGSEAVAVELMHAGAADYIAKASLSEERLRRRVATAVRIAQAEARAQAAAEHAARVRDDVIAIVSHDLRSPLNAIAIAAEELASGRLDDDERARYGSAIQRSIGRANRLIADLLDVSKIDGGVLEVTPRDIDVGDVLAHALAEHRVFTEAEGVVLRSEPPATALRAMADRDRVLQALANLIANAVRHTSRGGTVVLAAHAAGPAGDGFVCFEVLDDGPGVAEADRAHVFDRFWQAKPARRAGAGLGLAIVKGIVVAHGGTVGVGSSPAGGARFYFTVPRSRDALRGAADAPKVAP